MTEQASQGKQPWSAGRLWWGIALLVLGITAMVLRFSFVGADILYGKSAISTFDFIVSVLVASGFALIFLARPAHAPADDRRPGQMWSDWAASVITVSTLSSLLISLMVLFQPVTPPSLATDACAGVEVRNAPYTGITSGDEGVNSRSGPARSFLPNGRFPKGCAVGFSDFCIGEPIDDHTGSTDQATWVTTRWLRIAQQPAGPRAALAHFLSDEATEARYVSDAFIVPATRYDQLAPGSGGTCPAAARYPYPAKTTLMPYEVGLRRLSAVSAHAENFGFAVWTPAAGDEPESYAQIYDPAGTPATNPGSTGRTGKKAVTWIPAGVRARVVVMAVPCLADNLPADIKIADTATYQLTQGKAPRRISSAVAGMDRAQLARAACQAST